MSRLEVRIDKWVVRLNPPSTKTTLGIGREPLWGMQWFWAIAIWSLDLWAWQRLNGCKFWNRGTENVASLGSQNFLSKHCCILATVFGEVSWLRFVPSNLYKANIKTFSCRDAVATIFLVLTRVSGGGSVASSKATVSYEDPALPAT